MELIIVLLPLVEELRRQNAQTARIQRQDHIFKVQINKENYSRNKTKENYSSNKTQLLSNTAVA